MFQRFTSLFLVVYPILLMAQPRTKAQSKVGLALRMIERGDSLLEANHISASHRIVLVKPVLLRIYWRLEQWQPQV